MLRIKPGAVGSGSKYADHCAMLPPKAESLLDCLSLDDEWNWVKSQGTWMFEAANFWV